MNHPYPRAMQQKADRNAVFRTGTDRPTFSEGKFGLKTRDGKVNSGRTELAKDKDLAVREPVRWHAADLFPRCSLSQKHHTAAPIFLLDDSPRSWVHTQIVGTYVCRKGFALSITGALRCTDSYEHCL